ncbi:MAG: PAS domain S-box protein, partial [Anaerolineaceae bacterium]|nr:PAS domain S-box protein [Anaerolineaceae bacterium]
MKYLLQRNKNVRLMIFFVLFVILALCFFWPNYSTQAHPLGLSKINSQILTDESEIKNILILHPNAYTLPWSQDLHEAIIDVLGTENVLQIKVFERNLDLPFVNEEELETYINFLKKEHKNQGFDLIIPILAPTADFILDHGKELFPDIPVIFAVSGASQQEAIHAYPNSYSIPASEDIPGNIQRIFTIFPQTKNIVIISGIGGIGQSYMEIAKAAANSLDPDIEIRYMEGIPVEEMVEELSVLPDHTVVLYLVHLLDINGKSITGRDVLKIIAKETNAPIFIIFDIFMGINTFGGNATGANFYGTKTGEIALEILNGQKPSEIPPVDRLTVDMYDWRELQRWHIPEKSLPEGSLVLYKEYTFWEQYKLLVIAVSIVFILEAAVIISLINNLIHRRRNENALKASEKRYRSIVADVPVAMYRFLPDGTLTFVNDAFCQFFGKSIAEMTGLNLFDLIDEEKIGITKTHLASLTAEHPIASHEHSSTDFRGKTRWTRWTDRAITDEDGNIIDYQSFAYDLTDRKQAEDALKQSESRYSELVNIQTDLIVRILPNKRISFVNDAYCRLIGIDHKDLIGTVYKTDFTAYKEDRDELQQMYDQLGRDNPVIIH